MSENEIDSLEIVVEAEANRANRALSGLEKRINKAATALEKFMVMAQGGISFKNVDVDKLFSGNAMDKAARSQGKKLADELISGFNLNKATPEVQRQVRELSQKIAGGLSANGGKSYSGLSTDLEALGKITAKNGSVAKSTSEEYQKLYNWIKTTSKIKITPETAKSLGDAYKNRVPVMKQKLSTKSGIELDSFYNEAKDMFPGLLKDANNVEDEFYQLNSALEKFYETSNSFYKPEWMEDAAYESIISGVNEIVAGIKKAKSESSDLTGSLKGVADTGKSFSDIFGAGMDTSGLERIVELTGSVRSQNGSGRANRSDLKYPAQEFKTLQNRFKDSTLDLDFSGMGANELRKQVKNFEKLYKNTKQGISDRIKLEGTDSLGGKNWYKQIMQMNQYENALDSATEALGRYIEVNEEAQAVVDRNVIKNSGDSSLPKSDSTSADSMNYDESAMKAVFGNVADGVKNWNDAVDKFGNSAWRTFNGLDDSAKDLANSLNESFDVGKVNTFDARIKELDKQLAELASKGLTEYDPEYDKVYRERAEVKAAKKQYDQEMQKSVKAEMGADEAKRAGNSFEDAAKKANIFKRAANGIKGAANNINSVKKSFDKVGKSIQNAKNLANKAIHPFHTLKELLGGSDGGNKRNGMPFGRMIGSSIMFSTIFGAISQIKQAIKEGSDNLVQYSSEYNKSISGMVSSLLYLKNAWAVAFAPVVNVVGPYIESFIDMLAGALNTVGQFMAALTGKGFVVQAKKAWKDYGAGLDTTKDKANDTAKAIKDLQNYTLGIDELNVIQPADNSGNSGSGSGSGGSSSGSPSISDMFETIEVPNSMNKLADKFKEAIKNSDFTDIGKMLGDKLSSAMESIPWKTVYRKANNFGKDLATFLNGLISPRLFYDLGATIANSINTALHTLNSFAINFDWKGFGDSLAAGITGFFENWDAELSAETFSHFGEGFLEAITGFIDGLAEDKTWEKIGQKIVDFICGIDWKGLEWDLGGFFKALKKALLNFPKDFKTGLMKGLFKGLFGDKMSGDELSKNLKIFDDMNDLSKKIDDSLIKSIFGKSPGISKIDLNKSNTQIAGLNNVDIDNANKAAEANFGNIGDWFKKRKEDIENAQGDIADWFSKKYQDARTGTENAFQDIGTWYADRKTDVKNAQSDIADWFGKKYEDARTRVADTFQDIGGWFGQKKTDIQTNMNNISDWFDTKFKGARGYVASAFQNIGSWFGDKRKAIQNNMGSISTWFRDTFRKAYDGITGVFDKIGSYFRDIGNKIKTPIRDALNGVIGGVNWVLGKLGSGKTYPYVNFATGTDGVAHDTLGVVNDQTGSTYRELVQFPNGKTIIPRGRNVMLPMPKGTKVLPADQTKALMRMQNIPHFKSGIGDFFGNAWAKIKDFTGDILDYVENPRKLMQIAIDKFTDLTGALEPGLSMAKGAVNSVFDAAVNSIKGLLSDFGGANVKYNPSAGVEQWRKLAKKALKLTGQYSESNLNRLLMQMQSESSGNPNAINNWDSNAKAGIPSKGLMQVIDPTFRSYALAPYNKNIYDPLSNMIAAIRYTVSIYGSLSRGWNGHGYAAGGFPMNGEVYVANENGFGSEYIGSIGNRHVVANNNQIVESVSSGVEKANDETNALLRTVIEYQKLILKKDTSVNMDGKRMDKQISKARRNTGFSFSPT